MTNIIEFRIKRVSRTQAKNWLSFNAIKFPRSGKNKIYLKDLFHGWRFIRGLDGTMYFANCIDPGITEEELSNENNTKRIKRSF